MKSLTSLTIVFLTVLSGFVEPAKVTLGQEETKPLNKSDRIRVVLVGDSTVTDNAGWGGEFAKQFNEQVEFTNLSAGGRSSKSFRTEGRWKKCLELKPNYVLIQFGHNDQPGKGPERETDPETTYRKNMEQYVDEARKAGIEPILVTSLTRRNFDENGKIQSTLIPYVEVVKKIAKDQKVPLIDLHALSISKCESLGPEGCKAISPTTREGQVDRTHLNKAGAKLMAFLMAGELRENVPQLAKHLRFGAIKTE